MNNKILFIAPKYFKIEGNIRLKLEEKGYEVYYINDSDNSIFKNVINKIPYIKKKILKYKRIHIENIANKYNINTLFVIRGSVLDNNEWIQFFKNTNIAHKVMYQWDSIRNYDYTNLTQYYNKIFTFDRKDSIDKNYIYCPLFWVNNNDNKKYISQKIDLLFVGIWHSDRIKILDKIYQEAKKKDLSVYIKVYYPFYLYVWLRYVKRLDIKSTFWTFKKISSQKMAALYNNAKCIIDINHPQQTGLTMRTIECIGYGKKLITTNQYIKDEPFYSENNIYIIDRNNINIDFSFLETPTEYPNIENYELGHWLDFILSK